MPRLYIRTNSGATLAYELKSGRNLLGRSPDADFQILDVAVSGLHCEMTLNGEGVRLRDLGSTNGTFLHGSRVTEASLNSGQTFYIGPIPVRLEGGPVEVSIPPIAPPAPEPEPAVDGIPCCENHREAAADRICLQCGKTYCEECVHVMRLIGGEPHFLCPSCSGHCAALVSEPEIVSRWKAFFARLFRLFRWSPRSGRG